MAKKSTTANPYVGSQALCLAMVNTAAEEPKIKGTVNERVESTQWILNFHTLLT